MSSRQFVNEFLQNAIRLCLKFMDHPNSIQLCQTLFRIFFHHERYSCFYVKPSKEQIPDELRKKFFPETDEDKAKMVAAMPVRLY